MHGAYVSVDGLLLRGLVGAVRAAEGPLACMRPYMPAQVVGQAEAAAAQVARVSLPSLVLLLWHRQAGGCILD